jgi:hypothetical protein
MPGSRSAVAVGLAVLAASLYATTPAYAAAPSNDDFDSATVATALPFSDTTSTVEATQAPDDPSCGGGGSVWYAFTPSADTWVEANTNGSDFDTMLGAYTGQRGALAPVGCNDDSRYGFASAVDFLATAGTTYHFMVDGFFGQTGTVVFNLVVVPAPLTSVTVQAASTGTVNRQGLVTVHGTITCDQAGQAYIQVRAVQSNRRFTSAGDGYTESACGPTATGWSATVKDYDGPSFVPGKVTLTYFAYAENETGSAYTEGGRTVTLVGVR